MTGSSSAEAAHAAWNGGWLAGARRIDSPNFGPRPQGCDVDLVVLHSISLPPGRYGGDAIERLFTNRLDPAAHPYFETIRALRVSSHFLIRRDGELLQFVSCSERAWHAGASSFRGRDGCNDFSIGIELEGLEGETFEGPQYVRLAALLARICEAHPVRAVASHSHIAPGRKNDPGEGFEWGRLRSIRGLAAMDFCP